MARLSEPVGPTIAVSVTPTTRFTSRRPPASRLPVLRDIARRHSRCTDRRCCRDPATTTIRLWDPATPQTALLKAEVVPPNLDRDPRIAYNSDGSRIASYGISGQGDGAGTSRLWDATTGKEIAALAIWQEGSRPLVFSPDGRRVAVGSEEFVYLFDAVTGRQLAVLGPHAKRVRYLAYSSDGRRIASTTEAGSNTFISGTAKTAKKSRVLRHTSAVTSVLFSPTGRGCFPGACTGYMALLGRGHRPKLADLADTKMKPIPLTSAWTARGWSRGRWTRRPVSGTGARGSWWPSWADIRAR